jgi:L-seryl-tRNA(Ser) seleniumtransferase
MYDALGVRPVINAAATLTKLGGSRMPPSVVAAMVEAAEAFVDLHELQRRVGEHIAELTHNEACYVTSGAAGGIMLAVASCIAGTDAERIAAFPRLDGVERTEVIVHGSQRNGYDYAARQTGARLVEIVGTINGLDAAISEKTACVLWFAGTHFSNGALPIEDVIEIAHRHGVPVIVDAAAQNPPISSLWHFTRDLGADVAIFSGGKGLRGPQSSGLVLGKRDIIEGCRANGSPNHGIGRPLKVGKEELAGILAAVEWSLAQDEQALLTQYEQVVADWIEDLTTLPGIDASRGYPSEAGQPHSRAILRVTPACPLTRDQIVAALWDGTPRVAVGTEGDDVIALNPQTIEPGEERMVAERMRTVLSDER